MQSPIVKHSIAIGSHKTSISLEDAFWQGLKDIAAAVCRCEIWSPISMANANTAISHRLFGCLSSITTETVRRRLIEA